MFSNKRHKKGFSILVLMMLLLSLVASTVAATEHAPQQSEDVQLQTGKEVKNKELKIALNYLHKNAKSLGLNPADLNDYVVTDQYVNNQTGATHLYLQQQYKGIKVYNAIININISERGEVVYVGNRFISDLQSKVKVSHNKFSASAAVNQVAFERGLKIEKAPKVKNIAPGQAKKTTFDGTGIALNDITAELMYQSLDNGEIRLTWDVAIDQLDTVNYWHTRIDVETGKILDANNLVIHETWGHNEIDSHATEQKTEVYPGPLQFNGPYAIPNAVGGGSYTVYAPPVESPNHGGTSVQSDPATANASPYGWHDTNGSAGAEYTYTRGNNVYACEDANANNACGYSPDGGGSLVFNYTALTQDAAITNLFYWNNIIHDVWYEYGFDEASGNFQENNYGKGGSAGDSVNADAQDGSGTCNANFATPTDGGNPRMQMYLCNGRDGDFDNGVIVHEYGHGISIRLTGGPNNSSCLNNTEQAGEGWSDWFGLMMTIEPGDAGTDSRGMGTYLIGEGADGPGIRDYPYSTNMSTDPRTYDAIKTAAIPHGVGSTWAAMLWEMTWGLIGQHGFDADLYNGIGGNNIAMDLVIQGLKNQPCSPGFVDARDAILQADTDLYGGANQCIIWEAFAKRGLGEGASQGSTSSRSDGIESYTVPAACSGPPTATPTPGPTPLPGVCTIYTNNTPLSLPNGTASFSSNLSVPTSYTISDVNLSINATHTYVGDLSFTLSHGGTSVKAIDGPGIPASTYGCSGDDINATLDDSAALPVEDQCAGTAPTINGTFSPNNALSAFNGQNENGTWTLIIDDSYTSGDEGTLNSWSVEICTTDGSTPTPTPVPPTATNTPVPPTATNTPLPTPTPTNTPVPQGFSDDMESGGGNWTVSSGSGSNNWSLGTASPYSGFYAWFAQDVSSISDQYLTLANGITLGSNATLSVWHSYATESGYDGGVMEISTNGGSTWTDLGSLMTANGYNDTISSSYSSPIGGRSAFSGSSGGYVQTTVNLSGYSGQTVIIRFRMATDSSVSSTGWYVDDVQISF